jgi:DNA-binding GntR family transcriptional regulator
MDFAASELRRLILGLELAPGEHLVENRLAERLGVSRNPVREAIRTLAAEGFVEISPRRGAFVARLTPSDAENIFDVRLALEPLGARLAARNGLRLGTGTLRDSIDRARAAMDAGQLDLLADLNTEFHLLVMEMSGNQHLISIALPTVRRAQWIYRQNALTRLPHSWSEHAGLIEAIAAGDEEAAEAEARSHVTSARRSFRDRIAQSP